MGKDNELKRAIYAMAATLNVVLENIENDIEEAKQNGLPEMEYEDYLQTRIQILLDTPAIKDVVEEIEESARKQAERLSKKFSPFLVKDDNQPKPKGNE